MKRALVWVNDPEAPSFRHRLAAHIPALADAGLRCDVDEFPRRRYGTRVLGRAGHLREFDLLVIAKFKLEAGERWLVRRRARRIAYDFDDAIYFAKPDRLGAAPDRSPRRVRKFEAMCAFADLVTAGNDVLGEAARRTARRVEVVPTGIDLAPYRVPGLRGDGSRVAWIGLPGNLPYLGLVEEALARVARRRPGLRLVVISDRKPEAFAAPVELCPWSRETEAEVLAGCGFGIMPLPDDDWTRGKGGFKLLQYMAAGLPTIASPVGINREITVDGDTGFLAATTDEWERAIERLAGDPALGARMGAAGRRRVDERYALPVVGRRLVDLYRELVEPN